MPHNFYLHSGLVLSRGVDRNDREHMKQALPRLGCSGCLGLKCAGQSTCFSQVFLGKTPRNASNSKQQELHLCLASIGKELDMLMFPFCCFAGEQVPCGRLGRGLVHVLLHQCGPAHLVCRDLGDSGSGALGDGGPLANPRGRTRAWPYFMPTASP